METTKKFNVRGLVRAAIIAAIYALLTIALAPISSGLIQCRVAEAMSILPYFTFFAVPGLFVGCLLANLLGCAARHHRALAHCSSDPRGSTCTGHAR